MARRILLTETDPATLGTPNVGSKNLIINQSGVVGTKDSSGVFSPIGGGDVYIDDAYRYSERLITSSEILSLGDDEIEPGVWINTEIELLSDPGIGKYYDIEQVVVEYKFNGVVYSGITDPGWTRLVLKTSDNRPLITILPSFITAAGDSYISFKGSGTNFHPSDSYYPTQIPINSAFRLSSSYDKPTGGNGEILVKMWYRLINFGTAL
jgi:hypothetical protein